MHVQSIPPLRFLALGAYDGNEGRKRALPRHSDEVLEFRSYTEAGKLSRRDGRGATAPVLCGDRLECLGAQDDACKSRRPNSDKPAQRVIRTLVLFSMQHALKYHVDHSFVGSM